MVYVTSTGETTQVLVALGSLVRIVIGSFDTTGDIRHFSLVLRVLLARTNSTVDTLFDLFRGVNYLAQKL